MSTTSQRDYEVKSSIVRNLDSAARECEQLAADCAAADDIESSVDLHMAALRYRQLAARAPGNWADADALAALTANAAADPDAEAYAARDTEEMPRVH